MNKGAKGTFFTAFTCRAADPQSNHLSITTRTRGMQEKLDGYRVQEDIVMRRVPGKLVVSRSKERGVHHSFSKHL